MFKKLFDRMLAAQNAAEVEEMLSGQDGVDMMFQKGKIGWEDHERLFNLGARMIVLARFMEKADKAAKEVK